MCIRDSEQMVQMVRQLARSEGIYPAPESAATLVAARVMAERGEIDGEDRVVAFLTGNAYKYLSALQ